MGKRVASSRMRAKYFPVVIFIITFFVLAAVSTTQNYIIGAHIDYRSVPLYSVVALLLYWVLASAGFTLFTRWQIRKNYELPMTQLAKATQAVAGGDFSVYVRAQHTADKADYLDVMIDDFNTMVAELGSIETLKTEFLTNVSHEIKTPLSVIQNYAELLQNSNPADDRRIEYAAAIIQSTKKLSGLIADILRLNRLEQQKIQPTPNDYDLCAQLSACGVQFEEIWEEKDIVFEADLEDHASIIADENLLELVWNNLLSNAFKFTDRGGKVTLKQTSTADAIIVSVSDTGCGMSEETLKHIFDKFYQGDTSRATEGNGLGLSLSLRVLQLSGGSITVNSTLGTGSEFTVFLPVGRE